MGETTSLSTVERAFASCACLSNVRASIRPGIADVDLDDYEAEHGVRLAPEVRAFYGTDGGGQVGWELHDAATKRDDRHLVGGVRVWPLYRVLGESASELGPWNQGAVPAQPDARLLVFDQLDTDNLHCVCLEQRGDLVTGRLWLVEPGRDPIPMRITIDEYLTHVVATSAFFGWQYLFTDVDLRAAAWAGIASELALAFDRAEMLCDRATTAALAAAVGARGE